MSEHASRIISNLEIVGREMREKGGDPAWHMSCEEAAKVLGLLDIRLAMLGRSGSEETRDAAFQMRRMISGKAESHDNA